MSLALIFVFLIPLSVNNKTATATNEARIIATGMPERVFRGDAFDVTLRFENNPGFMTMPIRIYVPEGLVLTHITFDPAYSAVLSQGIFTGPPGFTRSTGEITPIVGPAYAFVAWARTNNMTIQNFNLITYTFMAEEEAALGETDEIRISFANVRNPELPANSNRERLAINLLGDNGEIGSVIIATPFRITNFNVSVENIVSFNTINTTGDKDLFLIAAKYDDTGRLLDVYIRDVEIPNGFDGLWVENEPIPARFEGAEARFMLWEARAFKPLVS